MYNLISLMKITDMFHAFVLYCFAVSLRVINTVTKCKPLTTTADDNDPRDQTLTRK